MAKGKKLKVQVEYGPGFKEKELRGRKADPKFKISKQAKKLVEEWIAEADAYAATLKENLDQPGPDFRTDEYSWFWEELIQQFLWSTDTESHDPKNLLPPMPVIKAIKVRLEQINYTEQ